MIQVRVDFDKPLRPWDGFGVNYVETCQTRDYATCPQDYGGFSALDAGKRAEIIELVFGANGLRPSLVKMFLDPFHQPTPCAEGRLVDPSRYDHATTTRWMRHFAAEGLKLTRARGADLAVLTDLYGPPGWMTVQRRMRGRDLDPACEQALALYIAAWAKHLRDELGLPVAYAGFHNEGEDWERWPADGFDSDRHKGDDYNLYWSPEAVARFVPILREVLDANGLERVGVTPGETSNWTRFHAWGYADALADDARALAGLGLITSHGFAGFNPSRWFGDWRSCGVDTIRERRPELHAWVTSTSWSKMDARFVWEIYNSIYCAKVNGIIPWACIQNHSLWVGGDPNPGCAFLVDGSGGYAVQPGYYFYKQVCAAGQAGMQVVRTSSNDTMVSAIGFGRGATCHPEAIVLINTDTVDERVEVRVRGSSSAGYRAVRSSPAESYVPQDPPHVHDGAFTLQLPAGSVMTLYGLR